MFVDASVQCELLPSNIVSSTPRKKEFVSLAIPSEQSDISDAEAEKYFDISTDAYCPSQTSSPS